MNGVYQMDQKALQTLTEEINELFDPEITHRSEEYKKMTLLVEEAYRKKDMLFD